MNTTGKAVHDFHKFVLAGKGSLVTLLLILSFVNAHVELVSKEPRKFLAGVLIFALTGAVAGGFVAWNRGSDPETIFNAIFIATLFFFLFGICREFAGYYQLASGETHDSQKMDTERKVLKILGGLAIVIGGIYGGYLAFYKAKVKPEGLKIGSRFGLPDNVKFFVELVVFTLICGVGEYGVGAQHGEKGWFAGLTSFGLYVIAHLYLQYGGFYQSAFAPINWNKFN
jgi:hypothetical protein